MTARDELASIISRPEDVDRVDKDLNASTPTNIVYDLNALRPMRVDLTRDTYTKGMERIIGRIMQMLTEADDTVSIHIEHIPSSRPPK